MSDDEDPAAVEIRNKRAIPVVIVESHNEVVTHIHRAIKSKRIPSSGVKLLHFDSHPDLGIPDVPVSDITAAHENSAKFARLMNEKNWILPFVYSGPIDHVCWMHPIWSGQIVDRQPTDYHIGVDKKTNRLCVNVPEAYFFNNGAFCCKEDMHEAKQFGLFVAPIHETNTMCRVCENVIVEFINKPFILDIALDSFTTKNPFANRFNKEQFELIDQLYAPTPPLIISIPPEEFTDADVVVVRGMACADVLNAARRRQLSRLRQWLNLLANGRPISSREVLALWPRELSDLCQLVLSINYTDPNCFKISPEAVNALTQTLELANKKLTDYGENLPPVALASGEAAVQKALTELGLQVDADTYDGDFTASGLLDPLHKLLLDLAEDPEMPTGLEEDPILIEVPRNKDEEEEENPHKYPPFVHAWHPQYVSTEEEQQDMVDSMETLLNRLHNPGVITISRSVLAGYVPADQVDALQYDLMLALARIYGVKMLKVALVYEGSEKDAEKLKEKTFQLISPSEMEFLLDHPPVWGKITPTE